MSKIILLSTAARFLLASTLLSATACDRSTPPAKEQKPTPVTPSSAAAAQKTPAAEKAVPTAVPVTEQAAAKEHAEAGAEIGKPAPAFSLPDLEGKMHSLADYQGKPIVLEWFNPHCPFVKAAHTAGSLVSTAADLEKKGFVYLAINSGGPGKQGHGLEANAAGKESFGLKHPILLDERGTTGKAYGATNTPHVFLIDQKGTLVYAGAIDNSPDGEGKSPEGGKLVNYLIQAANDLLTGRPISIPRTKAYGCGVKYSH